MTDKYPVNSAAPTIVATSVTLKDTLIFNDGPNTVWLAEDSSIGSDYTRGMPVPAQSYKEWQAGRKCYAFCAPGQSANIIISQSAGLLSPPVTQIGVNVQDRSFTINDATSDAGLTNIMDMSRYASFQMVRTETNSLGAGAGETTRKIQLRWYNRSPVQGGVFDQAAYDRPVFIDDHWVYIRDSTLRLTDRVRGLFLVVDTGGVFIGANVSTIRQSVWGSDVANARRSAFYGNGLPNAGSVLAGDEGSSGVFQMQPSVAAAATTTEYLQHWAGKAVIHSRHVSGVITTNPIRVALVEDNTNRVIYSWPHPVGEANNVSQTDEIILPSAPLHCSVINDGTVLASVSVQISMLGRHE